jgi:hypothetical protein
MRSSGTACQSLLPGHIFNPAAVAQARLVARTAVTASLGELEWPMRLDVLDGS